MYSRLRPFLFRLDPERAHSLTLAALKWAGNSPISNLLRAAFVLHDPRLEVEAFGLRFANPVGLAAGYDKNGIALRGLSCLGFGHVEAGTVTRLPQAGNPRPRLHRVPEAGALVNSMGFPNAGVEALKVESGRWNVKGEVRVGINIGKGKDTPLEKAADDYCALLRQVHARADYIAINVSSPNTLGLRQLQGRAFIEDLLKAVAAERDRLTPRAPLLVKIAPDLTESEIDDVIAAVTARGVDGVIATNTTVSRAGAPARAADLKGGLSGRPLKARATEIIRYIAQRTGGRLPIIGVGGIASAADALEKLRAGACLVQIYTGLIYAGPGLARQINAGLLRACEAEGLKSVSDLSPALAAA
jgi:dihydroorotate dehydrogenase